MIQLASDPTNRPTWRPAAAEAKENSEAARRSRSGHAWPFIVRQGERRESAQEHKPAAGSDNGS